MTTPPPSASASTSSSNVTGRLRSGGPYETRFGYSRALRTGEWILVSGCTSVVDGQVRHPRDAAAQMRVALDVALDAVTSLGGSVSDVVRTRMYVVDRRDADSVGTVHGERFAQVMPAATMVVVSGLIDEAMLVEVELEARVCPEDASAAPGTAEAATTPGEDATAI
jgi:enamine deaminase RidA (YjgF/YER057c/UK114 family)